jgi:threonine/homoserine/homoserine lactone efflux protein
MIPLAKGMLTAFIMTLGVGPGMLINFHTSLRRGFAAGVSVVAGLYVSDLVFIAINYFGVLHLIQSFQHRRTGGIVCGAILCVFGISMVLKKQKAIVSPAGDDTVADTGSLLQGFLSGFVVNMTNPMVFVFWMTLLSIAALNFGFRTYPFFIYLAGVVGTALCLDIAKSYLFSRIKIGLKTKVMAWINHGIGTVLASAGIVIICRSIFVFT